MQAASRPDVDAIYGIPPTVAIEQRTSRGGRKSTVGTLTEVHHFLRLLFVKLGTQHCPQCDVAIQPQSEEVIAARILKNFRNQKVTLLAPLVMNRKGVYTDLAKWALGKGYWTLRVDGRMLATRPFPRLDRFKEHTIELPLGEFKVDSRKKASSGESSPGARVGKAGAWLCGKTLGCITKRACRSCGPASGARPRFLLQLQARLVRRLLWHRPRHRRGEWSDERARTARGPRARFVDRMAGGRGTCPQCNGGGSIPRRWRCAGATPTARICGMPVELCTNSFRRCLKAARRKSPAPCGELKSRLAYSGVGLGY